MSLALFALGSGCRVSGLPATPQRPTFSSNTATTAVGTVEVEAGIAIDPGDSFDSPVTAKYGLSDESEFFVAWSPYQWLDLPGSNGKGSGDTVIGTRRRLFEQTEEGRPSGAVQLSTKLPSGRVSEGLSSGEIDFLAAAILSKDYERASITGFYQLGFLGETGNTGVDLEHGLALAASIPVSDDLAGFGEIAGVFNPELDQDEVFSTLGLAINVEDSFILNVSVVVGLSRDAPDFQFLIGFTRNFGEIASWFAGTDEDD